MTLDKTSQIGSVKKVYAGFLTELVTMADRFTINCNFNLKIEKNFFSNLLTLIFFFSPS